MTKQLLLAVAAAFVLAACGKEPAPAPKKEEPKKEAVKAPEAPKAEEKKDEAKKDEAKAPEAPKAEEKKDEPKK